MGKLTRETEGIILKEICISGVLVSLPGTIHHSHWCDRREHKYFLGTQQKGCHVPDFIPTFISRWSKLNELGFDVAKHN